MPKKIGPITYNCRERLRRHRGVERNFDSAAMAALVNSGPVQERVAKGDMLGYYGHYARVLFGMEPGEAQIYRGKLIALDAAIRTTRLEAKPDGAITHEVEFLDTVAGERARRLHESNAGGFSSAISCRSEGGRAVPFAWHGFDYVYEPNFSGNRGYCLDGVLDGLPNDGLPDIPPGVFDSAAGAGLPPEAMVRLFDSVVANMQEQHERMFGNMARLQVENAELLTLLSKHPDEVQRLAKLRLAALDSAALVPAPREAVPLARVAGLEGSRLGKLAQAFDSVRDEALSGAREPSVDEQAREEARRPLQRLIQRGASGMRILGVR